MIAIDRVMPETTLGWWGWVRLLRTGSFLAAGEDNAVDRIVDALQLGKIVTEATVRREDILEPEFLQMLSKVPFLTLPGRVVQLADMPSPMAQDRASRSVEARKHDGRLSSDYTNGNVRLAFFHENAPREVPMAVDLVQ